MCKNINRNVSPHARSATNMSISYNKKKRLEDYVYVIFIRKVLLPACNH